MSYEDAEQLALDGLAPRKRRSRASRHTKASVDPIVRVVLDIQAAHLGQTFDYLIDEKDSEHAMPGAMVRVRFGGQRVNGIIWERTSVSEVPAASLRYVERVFVGGVRVSEALRRDITAIAEAYGGTRANILRLAIPPRVAKVEQEQRLTASFGRAGITAPQLNEAANRAFETMAGSYDAGVRDLRAALHGNAFRAFIVDPLPGIASAAQALAWMAMESLAAGHTSVTVLPDARETDIMMRELETFGLRRFAQNGSETGGWTGDVAVLTAALPPADRYRAWLAIATGSVKCVIGTRAAMYAPVEGPALFAIMDDAAYQQADGMTPYAQGRGVMRLRARLHGGTFVALANARSPLSQWELDCGGTGRSAGGRGIDVNSAVSGPSVAIRPLPSVLKDATPWVRWLNRDELARLADPSIGARVPHTAVNNIRQALRSGPVLFSIPADGVAEALSCANPKCLRQARCARCTGPLQRVRGSGAGTGSGADTPRCRWCGFAATNWRCRYCRCDRLRVVHVGAAGTADELRGLFRGVPVMLSSPSQPNGPIEVIDNRPVIVIATPGAEPRIRISGGKVSKSGGVNGGGMNGGGTCYGAYVSVAILDAWNSLYKPGLDARVDTLASWMRVASLCAPRTRGGQVLLLGETYPAIAQSLMLWDSSILARQELAERLGTGMPPAAAVACVWGRAGTVRVALEHIGVIGGDMAVCPAPRAAQAGFDQGMMAAASGGETPQSRPDDGMVNFGTEWPGLLGPVPIAQPRTLNARELEATADRVKAVVRVPYARREELAKRLKHEVARHVASREFGELRFQLDPKDLI
ncbi:primosomal protein N' [Bifidobacterium sp. 64T4]|uniref:primosomal protein N' family DNA-binding protein n=1 Tax=Bifidobacterium pongonis TaxID=2834432 RepID=UPI001C56EF2E|nr:primosomal protein N' [Bifidobacterium pongonis]MBW3094610.1 primosomal protein N' [Bifidobacterium pongonis]